MGCLKLDIDGDEEVETVEIVEAHRLPHGGLRDQTLVMGWEAIRWALDFDGTVVGISPFSRTFSCNTANTKPTLNMAM